MVDYNVVNQMMQSSDPIWSSLDAIYKSVEGTSRDKSLEVAELVAKFALFKVLSECDEKHDIDNMRRKAGTLISEINERYPFNVIVCLNNVSRGLRAYSSFHSGAAHLSDVDDILTLLLRGNDLSKMSEGTESIKDKVFNKVKSMFHIFNKDTKDSKTKIDKTDEKLKIDAKKDGDKDKNKTKPKSEDSKLDSAKEDGEVGDEVDNSDDTPETPEPTPPTTQSREMPEMSEDNTNTHETENVCVCAHKVAWEVLCNLYNGDKK